MIAWQKFGNDETPQSTGEKGDEFIGRYYVAFNSEYNKQLEELMNDGIDEEKAKNHSSNSVGGARHAAKMGSRRQEDS